MIGETVKTDHFLGQIPNWHTYPTQADLIRYNKYIANKGEFHK